VALGIELVVALVDVDEEIVGRPHADPSTPRFRGNVRRTFVHCDLA
jgi:hypothetical protein